MNTFELQQKLQFKLGPLNDEINVFAANRLPMLVKKPTYIISNMDPDTRPGSHWVAIHINENNVGEYFDSFGRKPIGNHKQFMIRNCKVWLYNNKPLQNELTSVCGKYCLVYLYFKSKHYSTQYFLSLFDKTNTLLNDFMLDYLYNKIYE